MLYLLKIFLLSLVPSIFHDTDKKSNIDDVRNMYGVQTADDSEIEREKRELEIEEKDKPNAGESAKDKEDKEDEKNKEPKTDKDGEDKDDKNKDEKKDSKADDKGTDEKKDDDEPVYRINKVEYTHSELVAKAEEFYGFKLETVGDKDAQLKLLSTFIDSSNLDEGKKIVNERHQENAETKKKNEEDFKKRNADLEKREKELDAKIKQAEELLKKDPDDEVDSTAKVKLSIKQDDAKEELEDLKKQKGELTEEARSIVLEGWYNDLITEFPNLKTDRHITELVEEYRNDTVKDPVQTQIALTIADVLGQYEAERKNGSKVSITNFCKVKYPSLIASKSSTEKKDDTKKDGDKDKTKDTKKKAVIDLSALTGEERLKRLKERQNGALQDPKTGQDNNSTESQDTDKPKPTLKSIGYAR